MDKHAQGDSELERLDGQRRLGQFLAEMCAGLGRSERRHWGAIYVRGLLSTSTRKTCARMVLRLPDGDVQALQQFVGQSPWAWEPVRAQLARHMVEALGPATTWIIDDTGFPKKGRHSVGVTRQYSGTLGKVGNCQIAVSLHYATDVAAVPLDFQVYLPREWLSPERRREGGVPADVAFQTKGAIALDLVDRALAWGVPAGVITADAGYGNRAAFRLALVARGLTYAVGIDGTTSVWPTADWPEDVAAAQSGRRGRPRRVPAGVPAAIAAQRLAEGLAADSWQEVAWREGTKRTLSSRFAAVRVRPAHGYTHA
ncbi:MAG: IS701 family transposase, partial [Chloroflexota bacterium]